MKNFMRTTYGDSEWSYIGEPSHPLQSALQGNGTASPMFVAISCVILSFLESQTIGVSIISVIALTLFTITAIIYEDQLDILIASTEPEDNHTSIQD